MAIQLNDNLYAKVNRPLDFKFGPFTNVAQANSIIPISQRYHGLLFGVYSDPLDIPNSDIEYYYYFDGLTDVNYKKLNSAVVPYIGATQDVDLGNNDIKADSFIVNSGTLSQFLKGDGSLDSNSYYLSSNPNSYITLASLSFQAGSGGYNSSTGVITIPTNNNQIINGSNFITLVSLSGSDPIQYNNTTGVISITQAGTANNGYLSSTDWNTFNNKQVAGSYLTTNTTQTITGIKVFNDFRLQLAAAGTSQPTVFQNSNSISSGSGGYNTLGFNSDSDLFFNDGTSNSVVLSFSNTTTRIYTLPDASGTLALTSQLPINPITGTITTGQVAFGTAACVIGGDSGFTRPTQGIISINANSPAIILNDLDHTPVYLVANVNSFYINFNTPSSVSNKFRVHSDGRINLGDEKWDVLSNGILQSNGAQKIQTSTGNLTLATAGGNGNILLTPNGTGNVGVGTSTPTARLHVQSQGALSTDIGFRVRNSADTLDIIRAQGDGSVFVGRGAGNVNTGADNSFFGIDAGRSNTTGNSNTANGAFALRDNTTGFNNTANGVFALRYNTTGVLNTANGRDALRNNTTGSLNTANGVNALFNNTTGTNNTANGVNAGRFIADGTTANSITNNSIFIGASTRAFANNQTNQIVIGFEAIGNGSNTVTLGNTSIIKTFLRGTINAGNLPTSATGLVAGDIWNDAGTLKIV